MSCRKNAQSAKRVTFRDISVIFVALWLPGQTCMRAPLPRNKGRLWSACHPVQKISTWNQSQPLSQPFSTSLYLSLSPFVYIVCVSSHVKSIETSQPKRTHRFFGLKFDCLTLPFYSRCILWSAFHPYRTWLIHDYHKLSHVQSFPSPALAKVIQSHPKSA